VHVPGWHDETRELRGQGKLRMAGIVEEQHPDRARLFMQWKEMDWPVLVDPLNLLNVSVVPITLAIDEHGIIRHVNPPRDTIERAFVDVDYPAPSDGPAPAPVRAPTAAQIERAQGALAPAEAARYGHARFLWAPDSGMEAVIAAYDQALESDPADAKSHFRRGVALRARYDSPGQRPGDFAAAVASWQRALDRDPNQYIWRRRIQQYGPRLGKPYPFYDWIAEARETISARGETPAPLVVEPGGAELAQPARAFAPANETGAAEPDPDGRIVRDSGDFIRLETALVPPAISPGEAVRVHLEFHPIEEKKAHWNNEVDDLEVWLEAPDGYESDRRRLSVPNPAEVVSTEVRRVELEVRAGPAVEPAPARLRGYALYYVCEDVDGTCLYRRQDIEVEVPVRRR
jgi:tetratricopeptide (TPR) repeat protein